MVVLESMIPNTLIIDTRTQSLRAAETIIDRWSDLVGEAMQGASEDHESVHGKLVQAVAEIIEENKCD